MNSQKNVGVIIYRGKILMKTAQQWLDINYLVRLPAIVLIIVCSTNFALDIYLD